MMYSVQVCPIRVGQRAKITEKTLEDSALHAHWYIFGWHKDGLVDISCAQEDVFTRVPVGMANRLVELRRRFCCDLLAVLNDQVVEMTPADLGSELVEGSQTDLKVLPGSRTFHLAMAQVQTHRAATPKSGTVENPALFMFSQMDWEKDVAFEEGLPKDCLRYEGKVCLVTSPLLRAEIRSARNRWPNCLSFRIHRQLRGGRASYQVYRNE